VKNKGSCLSWPVQAESRRYQQKNQGSQLFDIEGNFGKDISTDGLDQQAIHLALDLLDLVRRKRLAMTAMGTLIGLSGHQRMVFADNFSPAGSATEPDADTTFAVRETDIWKYFHFSHPLARRLNGPLYNRKIGQRLAH
jgi:hypothetical protein